MSKDISKTMSDEKGKEPRKNRWEKLLLILWLSAAAGTVFFGAVFFRRPDQGILRPWLFAYFTGMVLFWQFLVIFRVCLWNGYGIAGIIKKGKRILLRVLSVLFCIFLILALMIFWGIGWLSKPLGTEIKKNANGTYSGGFGFYLERDSLYEDGGPFYLRYLRPMSGPEDTDASITEKEWRDARAAEARKRQADQKKTVRRSSKAETNTGTANRPVQEKSDASCRERDAKQEKSDPSYRDSHAEQEKRMRQTEAGYRAVRKKWYPKSKTFEKNYDAKGNSYYVLKSSEQEIRYLMYARDSSNDRCGLYVYGQVRRNTDGSYSLTDAALKDIYAYEYRTGKAVSSGKTAWSDPGSAEYRKLTGE